MNTSPRLYIQPAQFDNWGTPRSIFEPLDREFHFTLDVCAESWNTKCQQWYGPGSPIGPDGLALLWGKNVCWCNPPYGGRGISRWLDKAIFESAYGTTTVLLLPDTTEVVWFHNFVWDGGRNRPRPGREVRFVRGRIKFDPPPGYVGKAAGTRKGNMIIVVRPI